MMASSVSLTPLRNVQTTVHCWLTYRPKPLVEITRVIIRMRFLQESALRMNGLHESNSKLNIRSYPKAKKTDSDLILLLCPQALCSGLSTFETLQCINHLRFIALSRSQVHMDILHVSFYTLAQCFFEYLWILQRSLEAFSYHKNTYITKHAEKRTRNININSKKSLYKNVLEKEIPPRILSHSNDMGPHLSLSARGKTPSPGREGNRRLISSLWHLHRKQPHAPTHGRWVAHRHTLTHTYARTNTKTRKHSADR